MRRRPTPALIIAVLALIVAMSGTAVAAGVLVKTSDQLADGVVTNPKLARDSVDSRISSCVYAATPGETRRGGTLAPVILDVQQRPGQPHVVQIFVRDADGSFFTPLRPSFHLIVAC